MKRYLFLSLLMGTLGYAQVDVMPDSPLDTNMGEAAGDTVGTLNQIKPNDKFEKKQEQERQEELLENRYDVPDDKEEEEFNKNGN
jgi:hypothetical protein